MVEALGSIHPAACHLFFEIHKQDFEALSHISLQLLLQYFNTLSCALEALLDLVTRNDFPGSLGCSLSVQVLSYFL